MSQMFLFRSNARFTSAFASLICLTSGGISSAQSVSEGIEIIPGTGSGNEVFVTQELEPTAASLNRALIEILGDDNIVGGFTTLGQFTWAFDGGADLGQTTGQFGTNNVLGLSQVGTSNVIGFFTRGHGGRSWNLHFCNL